MADETSEDLVKRLMSEIRAHGKAMEAANYERRDSSPGVEEVRDVDIYDNNATFVIRKPVERKSEHTFLTVNNPSSLVNGKMASSPFLNTSSRQAPILTTFQPHPSSTNNKFPTGPQLTTTSTPGTLLNRNYFSQPQLAAAASATGAKTLTATPITVTNNGNRNPVKGESDVSCYSSISSNAVEQIVKNSRVHKSASRSNSGQLMCDPNHTGSLCPTCGVAFMQTSDSEPAPAEPFVTTTDGISIKPTLRSGADRSVHPSQIMPHHKNINSSVIKCDHVGLTDDTPPQYSPCRLYNGRSHNQHHSNERIGSKVTLSMPKVPHLFGSKSGNHHNACGTANQPKGRSLKCGSHHQLKYIKKVSRCPGCSGKCYIEPLQRSVSHLSLSPDDNLFTIYCPSCSKTGLTRVRGPLENGSYLLNGGIDKQHTYYSGLPRLWDTEMWHRKRKRASMRKNEQILIVFTSIVSIIIFMTLTYFGVITFQKITELPKIG